MKLSQPCLLGWLSLAVILLQPGFSQAQTASPATASATAPAGAPAQPINITASQGIEWLQAQQEVIATGDAKAVHGAVTVIADQLIAHYRKKAALPGQTPPPPVKTATAPATIPANDPEGALDSGDTEIYQLDAVGHVHIYTITDNAYGDHAVYSMDSAVLVLTGKALRLTTPTDVITARDSIEYYSVKRMAVARGNALIVTNDGRSIAADTLIGYLAPASTMPGPPAPPSNPANPPDMLEQGGKLRQVDAIGHVVLRSPTEMAAGNRGVYLPEQGLARLGGNVHIIRGPNQLNGADALLNTKTGVATLLAGSGGQVSGVVVPSGGTPQ